MCEGQSQASECSKKVATTSRELSSTFFLAEFGTQFGRTIALLCLNERVVVALGCVVLDWVRRPWLQLGRVWLIDPRHQNDQNSNHSAQAYPNRAEYLN